MHVSLCVSVLRSGKNVKLKAIYLPQTDIIQTCRQIITTDILNTTPSINRVLIAAATPAAVEVAAAAAAAAMGITLTILINLNTEIIITTEPQTIGITCLPLLPLHPG